MCYILLLATAYNAPLGGALVIDGTLIAHCLLLLKLCLFHWTLFVFDRYILCHY